MKEKLNAFVEEYRRINSKFCILQTFVKQEK